MINTLELSKKLIEFKSITPKSAGSLEYIQKILKKKKFDCHLVEFGKERVKNLYASLKGGNGPVICFAGHTDVVPPGDTIEWKSNPFKASIKNGKLYGRGASDMKTAIASFIVATFQYLETTNYVFDGTISFLLTADEEGDAQYGTKEMINWLKKNKISINYCLVGEPTNPEKIGEMIKIGRRGSVNFILEISGMQGHVAYPEKAVNPIDHLIQINKELNKPFDKGSKNFQPTKLIITSIDTFNKVSNLIPGKIIVRFNVRFSDNFKSSEIIRIIKKRVRIITSNFKLSYKVSGESFINYSEMLTDTLTQSIKKITKISPELSTSGGTSDARFISKLCPVLEFGSIGKTMHKANEMIEIKNIEKLTQIYFEFLKIFFHQSANK